MPPHVTWCYVMTKWQKMNKFFSEKLWGKIVQKITLFYFDHALPCRLKTSPCPNFPSWGGIWLGRPELAEIVTKSTKTDYSRRRGSDFRDVTRFQSASCDQCYKRFTDLYLQVCKKGLISRSIIATRVAKFNMSVPVYTFKYLGSSAEKHDTFDLDKTCKAILQACKYRPVKRL